MVDVVDVTDSAVQVQEVADRSNDILKDDVLRAELFLSVCDTCLQLVLVTVCLFDDIHQDRIEDLLGQLVRCQVDVDVLGRIYEVVSDNLGNNVFLAFCLAVYEYSLNTCVLDLHSHAS